MASTSLTKAVQKNSGNDNITKMTFSAWIKRSRLGEGQIFNAYQLSTYYTRIYFNSSNALAIYSYINGSQEVFVKTNRLFRDTNAWYHIVVAVDTTQATASDRIKIYINGVQETSFASGAEVYPSLNSSFGQFNDTGATLYIGSSPSATNFDGIMSHIHYTPYTAYDATAFGSTDSTTGEWKILTVPSVTYSTAGFFILKDGNSVTDQSGNSNNFTVAAGTLTKTEDCPSNVFCAINPLRVFGANGNETNLNLGVNTGASAWRSKFCTMAVDSGKWYYEAKWLTGPYFKIGFVRADETDDSISHIATAVTAGGVAWYSNSNGELRTDDAVISGWANTDITNITSISTGDIFQVAVDMDNKYAYFGINGTWAKSGDPTSGSSGTGGYSLSSDYPAGTFLMPAVSVYGSSGALNFGNGYFGTTAVSSAGTNASGLGIFEYDVPTGYTAICTKGLNE